MSAHVTSIEAVSQWKDKLCVFRENAQEALCTLELEVRRAFDWLHDQTRHWQKEVRGREEAVVQAKAELRNRKTLSIDGRDPDCTVQEKALRRALERLAEAEDKLEATRRWKPTLEQAVEEYETQAARLRTLVESDLARGLALLEQKLASLEAYVALPSGFIPQATSPAPPEKKEDAS